MGRRVHFLHARGAELDANSADPDSRLAGIVSRDAEDHPAANKRRFRRGGAVVARIWVFRSARAAGHEHIPDRGIVGWADERIGLLRALWRRVEISEPASAPFLGFGTRIEWRASISITFPDRTVRLWKLDRHLTPVRTRVSGGFRSLVWRAWRLRAFATQRTANTGLCARTIHRPDWPLGSSKNFVIGPIVAATWRRVS